MNKYHLLQYVRVNNVSHSPHNTAPLLNSIDINSNILQRDSTLISIYTKFWNMVKYNNLIDLQANHGYIYLIPFRNINGNNLNILENVNVTNPNQLFKYVEELPFYNTDC